MEKSSYKIILMLLMAGMIGVGGVLSVTAQPIKNGITISFDGKVMIYTAEDNGTTRFYQSVKGKSQDWSIGNPIDELTNRIDSLSLIKNPFLSPDGQTLYFSAVALGSKNADIYYAPLKNGKWQKPQPMGSIINTDEDEENPSITADNRYFYFTRKIVPVKPIPDDEACRTIYCAKRNPDGKWQTPEIVKLSSVGCEAYPLIFPDGKTLLFSSNKLPQKRKRKYDLYYVIESSADVWSMPQPVDSLNTEADEISAAVDYQNKQLYVLQVEQVKKETKSDVASFSLPADIKTMSFTTVNGKIFDKLDNKPVRAEIKIDNAATASTLNTITANTDGHFTVMLPNKNEYRFIVNAKGYSHNVRHHNFSEVNSNKQLFDTIALFKSVKLALNVYDKEVFTPLNATMTVIESGNEKNEVRVEKQNVAGRFLANLSVGKSYTVKIRYAGYIDHIFKIDATKPYFNEIEEDIALVADRKEHLVFTVSELNGAPLDARVEMLNSNINEVITVEKIRIGEFNAALRKNNSYDITVARTGYSFSNQQFKTNANKVSESITVKLIPLTRQTKIAFSAVGFAANGIDLTTESYKELNNLANVLLENPEVTIEIGAYIDNKADAAYCDRLSAKQALSIADYLSMMGVVKERITTKGYGKNQPTNVKYSGKAVNKSDGYAWFTVIEPAREWAHIPSPEPAVTNTKKPTGRK